MLTSGCLGPCRNTGFGLSLALTLIGLSSSFTRSTIRGSSTVVKVSCEHEFSQKITYLAHPARALVDRDHPVDILLLRFSERRSSSYSCILRGHHRATQLLAGSASGSMTRTTSNNSLLYRNTVSTLGTGDWKESGTKRTHYLVIAQISIKSSRNLSCNLLHDLPYDSRQTSTRRERKTDQQRRYYHLSTTFSDLQFSLRKGCLRGTLGTDSKRLETRGNLQVQCEQNLRAELLRKLFGGVDGIQECAQLRIMLVTGNDSRGRDQPPIESALYILVAFHQ